MNLSVVPDLQSRIEPRNSFATNGYVDSADGTKIHYYTVGDGGPAIVCCDGLGCDGYVWKYVAEDLAPDFQVVRWHYRGHGQSGPPAHSSHMRIEDLCEDLEAVLKANGIEKAVLLGHSLGVQVILEFQKRHPERVIALVPVCGSYGRVTETFRDSTLPHLAFPWIMRFVRAFPSVTQRAWSVLDTELAYQIALRSDVNGDLVKREDFRPYLAHLGAMDVRTFFTLAESASINDNLLHLPEIDIPTLIVAGERDGFTPFWLSAVMHARIPDSELLAIPTGTHTAPIEMPELMTLRLRRFLEDRVLPLMAKSRVPRASKVG